MSNDDTPEEFHRIRASAEPDNPIGVMEFICVACRDSWLSRQPSEPCALYGIPGLVLDHIRENPTHPIGFVIHDHPMAIEVGESEWKELRSASVQVGDDPVVDAAFKEAANALIDHVRRKLLNQPAPSTTTHPPTPTPFLVRPKKHPID